jgi:AcrR family transcriptional regulator
MTNAPRTAASAARAEGRRGAILDAAGETLLRYGFRKTSVDEVARAAGISRQGLYLHFPTKDALVAATIDHLLDAGVSAARTALDAEDPPIEERIWNAFAAMAGDVLATRLDELLQEVKRLTGRSPEQLEALMIAEFAHALDRSPAASAWRRNGDSADDVAAVLYATSAGLKRSASSMPEYLDKLRIAIRLVCRP